MSIASSSTVLANVRNNILPSLGFPCYCTAPFPVRSGNQLQFGFLIGRGEVTSKADGYQIWVPVLFAMYSSSNGTLMEMRRMPPSSDNANRNDEEDRPIQKGVGPVEKTQPQYVSAQVSLLECLDKLAEQFSGNGDWRSLLPPLEFAFKAITESSLHRYYDGLIMKDVTGA